VASQRVGDWLFDIPDGATIRIDPDGSHHFDGGSRYIYAVSNNVSAPAGRRADAATLHRAMAKGDWSYELKGREGFGWAKSLPFEDAWHYLQSTREGNCVMLSCTLSFRVEADLEWALNTWRRIAWSPV